MATHNLEDAHAALAPRVESILWHINHPGKLPSGLVLAVHTVYRPPEEQLAAYLAGNSQLKAGPHNRRPARAVDLVYKYDRAWSWNPSLPWWLIGYWAEAVGLMWGGRWGTTAKDRKREAHAGMPLGWDCPHVELPDWRSKRWKQ